ncbi:MAG TPA: hypothetical protein VK993_04160 [Chthoniobacterales bacterium]|nr:hypothetical protein [Chthoniobacterales bacterium]
MAPESVAVATFPAANPARPLLKGRGAVLAAFVASRLMVGGVILLSRLQVPPGPFWRRGGLLSVLSGGEPASYLDDVQAGRWFDLGAGEPGDAFFPVFPVLLKLGALVFGDLALAGVVIANSCLLGAGLLLHQLLRLEYEDPRISRFAVVLLMFSPASYFFSCAVPDSTALLLAVASLLAAAKGRWVVACLCGMLLCATISLGYWIVVPLTLEFFRQSWNSGGGRWDRLLTRRTLLLVLVFAPLVAAVAVGSTRFDDSAALLRVSGTSAEVLASLLKMSAYFEGYAWFYELLFGGTLLAAEMLCMVGFVLKLRATYLAFAIVLTAACAWGGDLQAPRTLGLCFPLFTAMGLLSARFDWLYDALLVCSMMLLALCTIIAANGFWIG